MNIECDEVFCFPPKRTYKVRMKIKSIIRGEPCLPDEQEVEAALGRLSPRQWEGDYPSDEKVATLK